MIVKTPAKKHKTGHYRINFLLVLCANYNHHNTKTRKNKSERQNQTSYCKNQNEKKKKKSANPICRVCAIRRFFVLSDDSQFI